MIISYLIFTFSLVEIKEYKKNSLDHNRKRVKKTQKHCLKNNRLNKKEKVKIFRLLSHEQFENQIFVLAKNGLTF